MRPVSSSRLAAAAVLLLASAAGEGYRHDAIADFQPRSYVTGKELVGVCSEDQGGCYMYIYGVLDKVLLNDDINKTCLFNPEGLAGDKAVSTFLAYMASHQDRLDWSAAALVQNAIRSKFPCPKKKPTDKSAPNAVQPDATQPDSPGPDATQPDSPQ